MKAVAMSLGIAGMLWLVAPSTRADDPPETAAPQRVMVRLTEYRFDPARIELKTGQDTELTLLNEGTVLHEFMTDGLRNVTADVTVNGVIVEALGVGELEIPAKTKAVLRFTPKQAGTFRVICEAEKPTSHVQEGMTATLVFR